MHVPVSLCASVPLLCTSVCITYPPAFASHCWLLRMRITVRAHHRESAATRLATSSRGSPPPPRFPRPLPRPRAAGAPLEHAPNAAFGSRRVLAPRLPARAGHPTGGLAWSRPPPQASLCDRLQRFNLVRMSTRAIGGAHALVALAAAHLGPTMACREHAARPRRSQSSCRPSTLHGALVETEHTAHRAPAFTSLIALASSRVAGALLRRTLRRATELRSRFSRSLCTAGIR